MSRGVVRFTPDRPCVVCGGHERLPRGQGVRCDGFLSSDGEWAHCSRPEHAGLLPTDATGRLYAHRMQGPCRCGTTHGERVTSGGLAVVRYRLPRRRAPLGAGGLPVWKDPDWHLVATYVYCDAGGVPVYRVRRWERKDGTAKHFSQQRPCAAAQSGWIGGLGDIARVPYRLPELLATSPTQPVLIPEGEACVEALRDLGVCATTNSEGAHRGSWRPELSPWLRDRHVVLMPDNDEVGRAHAHEVATALFPVAASVRWLMLPALPARGDVCDWLAAGGGPSALAFLIREAPAWRPLPTADLVRRAAW